MATTQPTVQMQQQVAELYLSMLGRNPDAAGFSFWVNGMVNGQTQYEIAIGFSHAPEFDAVAAMTPVTAVQQLYQNILGRSVPANDPGVVFWSGAIAGYQTNNHLTYREALGQIAVNISSSAFAQGNTTADGIHVTNAVNEAIQSGLAQTFTLTTGADIATATTFNGIFAANIGGAMSTLNGSDKLTGASSTGNTLNVVDDFGTGSDIMPVGLTLNNIQTIHLQTAGNAGQVNLANGFNNGSVYYDIFNTSTFASVTATVVDSQGGDGYYYAFQGCGSGGGDQVQASNSSSITVNHHNVRGSVETYGGGDVTVNTNGNGGVAVIGYESGSSQTLASGHVTVNANGALYGAANVIVAGGTQVDVTVASSYATGTIVIGDTIANQNDAFSNPTGAITVTDNANDFANNYVNTVLIAGGTNVQVTAKGDTIQVGNSVYSSTPGVGSPASDAPSGTVVISDLQQVTYNNLTGAGNTEWIGGSIEVYGGTNVSVTTNTGGQVQIGADNGTLRNALPSGTITLVDQASDKYGSFNIGQYNDPMGGPNIMGGTTVNATLAGTAVYIGVDGADSGPYTNTVLNPTGAVTVTETVNSSQSIYVDGGNGITVSAKGQSVALGTFTGVNGAVSVTQNSVYSGNALGSDDHSGVFVDGGTTVNVITTGGDVYVGGAYDYQQGKDPSGDQIDHVASGAVTIRDKFSGADTANNDYIEVLGGTTVNITVDNSTAGDITVGTQAVINTDGITLKNGNLDPTGNVTIVNAVTHGSTTTYGSGQTTVRMNGGTTANITGGSVQAIVDVQQLKQNLGANAGSAVGTSHLTTVILDGVSSTYGPTIVDSGVLSSITIKNSGANGQEATHIETDPLFPTMAASSAGALSIILSNDAVGTSVADNTTTAVTVTNPGSTGDSLVLVGSNIATTTLNNAASLQAYVEGKNTNAISYTGAGALNLELYPAASFADSGTGNVTLHADSTFGNITDTNASGYFDLGSIGNIGNFTQTGAATGYVSLYSYGSIGNVATTTSGTVEINAYSSGSIGSVTDSHASSITVSAVNNIGAFSETGNGSVNITAGGNLASFSDTGTGAVNLSVEGNVGGNIVNHSAADSTYDIGGTLGGTFTNSGAGNVFLGVNNGIGNIIDNSTAAGKTLTIWLPDTAGSFTQSGLGNVEFIEGSAGYLTGTVTDTSSGTLDLGDVSDTTTLTSIVATGATGAVSVILNANETSFAGGSGNDNVTLTSATVSKTISGGAGSNTLTVDFYQTNNTLLQSNGGHVSGFSTLVINSAPSEVIDTGTAPGDTGGSTGYIWNAGRTVRNAVETVTITGSVATGNEYSIQLGSGATVTFAASSNITTTAQVASGLESIVAAIYGTDYTVSAASGSSFTITAKANGLTAGGITLSTAGSTGGISATLTTTAQNGIAVDPYYDAAGFSNIVLNTSSAIEYIGGGIQDVVAGVYNFVNVATGTTLTLDQVQPASYQLPLVGSAVNYILANSSGANDTLPITVGVDGEGGTFATLNGIYTSGVENITINSHGNASTLAYFESPIPTGNTLAISDAGLKTITITGDSATVVLLGDAYVKDWLQEGGPLGSSVTSVDASGSSGEVALGGYDGPFSSFAWKADAAHTITGGSGMLYGSGGFNSDDGDTWVAGSGGFDIYLGYGGSFNTANDNYSANAVATVGTSPAGTTYLGTNDTGYSRVNLTAASGVSSTVIASNYVQADLTSGGITGFKVVGSNLADVIVTGDGGPGGILPSLDNTGVALWNTSGPVTVGNLDLNHMALSFDPSGTLTTLLANLTYTSSNGMITFAATNGHQLSSYTDSQLVEAAQLIVSYSSMGGEGQNTGPDSAFFISNGNTFVVKSNYDGSNSDIGGTHGTIAVGGLVQDVQYASLAVTNGLSVSAGQTAQIGVTVNGVTTQIYFGGGDEGTTYTNEDVAYQIANQMGSTSVPGVTAVQNADNASEPWLVTFVASDINTLGGQTVELTRYGTSVTGIASNEVVSTDNVNTVVELIGTAVAKSFSDIGKGASTALLDGNVTYTEILNFGDHGTAAARTMDGAGYSLAGGSVGTTSTTITNLGGSSGVGLFAVNNSLGTVTTTQAAGSAIKFFADNLANANYTGSINISGDWYAGITNTNASNYAMTLTSLTDATNTLKELELGSAGGSVIIQSIVGTALTSIVGDGDTVYKLGGTTALAQNGLSITLGSNDGNEVYTSGNNDVITLGDGNETVVASGSANTIHIGGGSHASITANGAGDTITSTADVRTLVANGNTDTISILADVNSGGLTANGNGDNIYVEGAVNGSLTAAGNNDVINVAGVVAVDTGKVAVINGNNDVINLGGVDHSLTANGDNVQIRITTDHGAAAITASGSGDTITVGTFNDDGSTAVVADVGTLTVGGTANDNFANTVLVTGDVGTLVSGNTGDNITILGSLQVGTTSGAGTTISVANGWNHLTAAGAGDHISSGDDIGYIIANGNNDVVSIGGDIDSTSYTSDDKSSTINGNNDTITVSGSLWSGEDAGNATLTANGNSDVITIGGGDGTLIANGTNDTITVGGTLNVHASGTGDTFNLTDNVVVDGGLGLNGTHYAVANNSTINVSSGPTDPDCPMVYITGDTRITVGSIAASLELVLNNATNETTASSVSGYMSNQVNVSSAVSLLDAENLAASVAAAADPTGANKIAAHTGVIDWFQYGGNTYVVEAINSTGSAATHTSLGASDVVITIVGLHDLSSADYSAHSLTINT